MRAAGDRETIWEDVLPGKEVETLAVVQATVTTTEGLLGLGGGTEEIINWLLGRGYQVTGKFTSTSRVRKLGKPMSQGEATSSVGRDVTIVPEPAELGLPVAQYAGCTVAKERPDEYDDAVLFSSRTARGTIDVVDHDDGHAGMEADLKSDKRGWGLADYRQPQFAAPEIVVLLIELAHNVLIRARDWVSEEAPQLAKAGIVRRSFGLNLGS